jgi:hypothetical protein
MYVLARLEREPQRFQARRDFHALVGLAALYPLSMRCVCSQV